MGDTSTLRKQVCSYIRKEYGIDPEYLWRKYPDYAVFRHEDNQKWFAVIMNVRRSRLGLMGDDFTDILNVKVDDLLYRDFLLQQKGYLPGYHFARGKWVSVLLDGTVSLENILSLIDASYRTTASAKKKEQIRPPKEWIVPANPKYYDIVHAFDDVSEIDWKQGRGIKKGDTVYMYVAAPVSAVLYQCTVTDPDQPCDFDNGKLSVRKLMRIRLVRRYGAGEFTFERLKDEFGIYAVRGPRGIPNSLHEELNRK